MNKSSRRFRQHIRACKLLGISPSYIKFIGKRQAEAIEGFRINSYGHACQLVRAYWVKGLWFEAYIHEILHVLFPEKPHLWIFEVANTIAHRGDNTLYTNQGHIFWAIRPLEVGAIFKIEGKSYKRVRRGYRKMLMLVNKRVNNSGN